MNSEYQGIRLNSATMTLLIIAGFLGPCWGDENRSVTPESGMAFLENGLIKVGADLRRGGSIGFLADVQTHRNVVNTHDLGRWIGQSYYSGPKPFGTPHVDWPNWPWNPISAGDVYGNASRLIETTNDGKTLYIKSIPMQWALNNVPGECTFETWISLDRRSVKVRNRLSNHRQDQTQYPAMDQELPAVYTIGTLHRLFAYTGDTPFTDGPISEIPKKAEKGNQPQWTSFDATEHWAALVNDEHWGLGVIHPNVVRFIGGFYGKVNSGGPNDDSNGYVAAVRQEILDHNIVYEFGYTLVLDTLTNIRKEACRQRPPSSRPEFHFQNDRNHWWFLNATDSGYPIKNGLHLRLESEDPQLYSPEMSWSAADVPRIDIRAAFQTKGDSAQLFWETANQHGFSENQSMRFVVVPDGKFRTYEVDLSSSPAYVGQIRRLRFDPVDSGGSGESATIEFISASRYRE